MRRLLAPGLDAPDITAIEEFVRAPEDGPRKLQGLITTDLPTAADFPYGLIFDLTASALKISDGTSWNLVSTPLGAGLTALEALNTNGLLVQTANDTFAGRTLTAPAAGFTITNPAGIAGNPTFVLANDLAALEALSGTSTIYYRSGTDTWSAVTIGGNLGFSAGTLGSSLGTAATKATGTSGNTVPLLDGTNTWSNTQTGSGGWLSTSVSAGVGYAAGAGGTVTQLTSKSTSITLNKIAGSFVTHNASLAATTSVGFLFNNSSCGANDVMVLNFKSGNSADSYTIQVDSNNGSGTLRISLRNITAGSLSEAITVNFAIIKGAVS